MDDLITTPREQHNGWGPLPHEVEVTIVPLPWGQNLFIFLKKWIT